MRRPWWTRSRKDYRRYIGTGNTLPFRVKHWVEDQLAKVIPGRCTSCPGRNYTHKMSCPKLRGVPGKKLWSQSG